MPPAQPKPVPQQLKKIDKAKQIRIIRKKRAKDGR
jgi:hypothetical protein